MEQLGAGMLLVSGQGLREGIAYAALDATTPSPEEVRRASIAALTQRFRTWDPARAERRTQLAAGLAAQLQPELPPLQRELLQTAATVLDIGRSIDYYNRFAHAASIVLEADLGGFSHHDLALLSAIISTAEKGRRPDIFGAVLSSRELEGAARLALLLALADEFERHLPPGEAPALVAEVGPERVALPAPPLTRDKAAKLAERFQRSYGKALCFRDWQDQGEEGVADELPEE
jgi:exopolyphosphatase/guanosine-5'-triphosphate,3'-diphosphate pyrophosphatase